MSGKRVHEVVVDDGVTLRGTVQGRGRPVVFLQRESWAMATSTGRRWSRTWPTGSPVTCSACGSRSHDDHSNLRIDRVGADYDAYVESLGEPTGLVGWSAGAVHALGVTARSDAVSATASYEPMVGRLMDEEERQDLLGCLARGRALVEQGDLPGAMRAVAANPFTRRTLRLLRPAATSTRPAAIRRTCCGSFSRPRATTACSRRIPRCSAPFAPRCWSCTGRRPGPSSRHAQHVVDNVPDARGCTIPAPGMLAH